MTMTKKKYEIPAVEIIQLHTNIAVMIADSYHDGGGFAPKRRDRVF